MGASVTLGHKTDEEHLGWMQSTQRKFARQIQSGQVMLHQGFSKHLLPLFPVKHFDWVYVDGDHRYEACLCDLELCDRLVRDSGFIAGHDYVPVEASSWASSGEYGVVRAVSEFCKKRGWEMIYFADDPIVERVRATKIIDAESADPAQLH